MKSDFTGFSVCIAVLILLAAPGFSAAPPSLAIDEICTELVPLYGALPANETFVTSLVRRESDGAIFGAAAGKRMISLFQFDPATAKVTCLDAFEALWWDEPVLAVGPDGSIYLAAKTVWDKQFVFERIQERPSTPDATYLRRDAIPAPGEVNRNARGMPIRHYAESGALLRELWLPSSLSRDGVGAITVSLDGQLLIGLTAPGGHLFTLSLQSGYGVDFGEKVIFPEHHHTRRISKSLMMDARGTVYFSGTWLEGPPREGDETAYGYLLAFDPDIGECRALDARLPAVAGRNRFSAIDTAVRLPDGSFLGGTTDGYLFRFDPSSETIENFGKPLRQHHVLGLAPGPDGWIYGAGGEPGGLPRLFAFDPTARQFRLGMPPTGTPPGGSYNTFGDIGAVVSAADGTLICGERERRGHLLLYRPPQASQSWSKTFTAQDFSDCTRDRFVALNLDTRGFQLAPTYLISDAKARSSKTVERLGKLQWAKKTFDLPSSGGDVEALIYHGGGTEETPMKVRINGRFFQHIQDKEKMLTGGWDRFILPKEHLHAGKNEMILSMTGALIVDTGHSSGNSAKSVNGGSVWRSDILGPDHNLQGEYVIRFRVHGHPQRGVVTSPVIDLAELLASDTGRDSIAPLMNVNALRLTPSTDEPPKTSIELEVRTGSTADGHPLEWTEWVPLAALDSLKKSRFVQWRATLRSGDMTVTPRLERMKIEFEAETAGVNQSRITMMQPPDNDVSVSSYNFRYADPHHPRMRHLREKYKLEEIVAPGNTESEKFDLLRQWVRRQWKGWDDGKYVYCPQWDALEILELAPAGLGLGMCTHYAATLVQCGAALGYNARSVIVDHHCLTEFWSNEHQKWIFQDAGLVPGVKVAFQYHAGGVPLNALELHERALKGDASDVSVVGDSGMSDKVFWERYLNLYSRFAIPFRNDHLYRAEPQELEHGREQYHWDGYLWWTDSLDPKYPEYSFNTNRPEDFYWTINKTCITLQDTGLRGEVAVRLYGNVPNLKTFQVRIDGGPWVPAENQLTWHLRPGVNRLEANAVNTMGVEGFVNRVELNYK